MANYRYLGYGITNDNGIAKLEFDENGNPITHSYTGTGAGELDIIASTDDSTKISDSSIQSEPYPVMDCLVYDTGINGTSNENWYNESITVDLTSGTYKEISKTTTNNGYYWCNIGSAPASVSDVTEFNKPFCIEVDIIGYSDVGGFTGLYFHDGTNQGGHTFSNKMTTGETHHLKEVVTSTKLSLYVDDNPTPFEWVKSFNNPMRVGFRVAGTCFIRYKNFKMYPISE